MRNRSDAGWTRRPMAGRAVDRLRLCQFDRESAFMRGRVPGRPVQLPSLPSQIDPAGAAGLGAGAERAERTERTESAELVDLAELAELAGGAGLRRVAVLAWRDIDDAEAGGSELHAHEVATRWAAAGIDVVLRTSAVAGRAFEIDRAGYRVVRRS